MPARKRGGRGIRQAGAAGAAHGDLRRAPGLHGRARPRDRARCRAAQGPTGSRGPAVRAIRTTAAGERLRQRADYTHKFNAKTGRHGWLRLTPAYSVKVAGDLLAGLERRSRVLDPFCGTATTALCASYLGHQSETVDVNPFLAWLGNAKLARYSDAELSSARGACGRAARSAERMSVGPSEAPPIHNIERWWDPAALRFLCSLRSGIDAAGKKGSAERDLLLVAFCRTLIGLSNAAFNHQSMSFGSDARPRALAISDMNQMFVDDMNFVLEGAEENPAKRGRAVLGDARRLREAVGGRFDFVVTSPPYANRMSYIRELRPYMYWLGFLKSGRDAGNMDWSSVGGTWGVATSRLAGWQRAARSFRHPELDSALDRIAQSGNKSSRILANYVAKYFDDMWAHFDSLASVLNGGARVHYIVGNSTFFGVLVPVEQIYAAMLSRLGFEGVRCDAIRKRNSKKDLVEFDVSAEWPR